MALNFPSNPTLDQVYTSGTNSWYWDGSTWVSSSSGLSGTSGYSGFSGYSGLGLSGYSGYSGAQGLSGYSGAQGLSGYSGYSGHSGYSGSSAAISYAKKTSNYLAVAGDTIIADTTSGSFTVTLPSSPSTGHIVSIVDGASWYEHNLTVAGNGSTIEGNMDDITVDVAGIRLDLIYDGTTWEVYAIGGPGTQARGGLGDQVFFENGTSVSSSYAVTTGMNAMSAGPITILDAATVTLPSGSTWTIV